MNEPDRIDVRALRVVIEEVRHSLPPEVDWEGVERRTLATIDMAALRKVGDAAGDGPSRVLGFALAAAACVGLIAAQGRPPAPRALVSVAAGRSPGAWPHVPGHLGAVALGSPLDSGDEARTVEWPGLFRVRFDPDTRVTVGRHLGAPALALEAGALQVEGRRSRGGPATLAVEAQRVVLESEDAVYRIASGGGRVTLRLDRGRVWVRARSLPATAPRRLDAPLQVRLDVTEGVVTSEPLLPGGG